MGNIGGQRLQAGAEGNTMSEIPTSNGGLQRQPDGHRRGSAEVARQRGNKGGQSMPQSVCQQDIPKKDGSFRPVINLRPLNLFMTTLHFKMDNLGMLRDLLRQGDYMASIDLKDAYLSVAVWKKHWKYLRLAWEGKLYKFQCLPFGFQSLHQAAEASISSTPSSGNPSSDVPGQYAGDGQDERGVGMTYGTDNSIA